MRYIVGLIISVAVLALGWAGSHSVMSAAQQWAAAGAELSLSQRVLFWVTAWFVRLFPFLVILLPVLGVLIARITAPRRSHELS
jgi:hypothetical protein